MSLLGEISPRAIEACKDFLDFARCVRPNGSAYGTSGKCRLGVESKLDESENKRLVKEALLASSEEYNSKFYPMIESILNKNADEFETRISNTPRGNLNESDNIKITAAKRLAVSIDDYKELKGVNPKAAAQLKSTKEFFDDMKWRLSNEQVLMTEGTLRAIWDGKDVSLKAKDLFPSEAQKVKFGQSKGAIGEHSHPTAVLKNQLLTKGFQGTAELGSFIIRKNFVTWVAGPEDARMTEAGLRSKTPNADDVFSRYKTTGIKALPINRDTGMMTKDGQGLNVPKWLKHASAAKSRGESFEDWAASVIQF